MSRIGRLPVSLPAGVTVTVDEGNVVRVTGPKGELQQSINPDITVNIEGAELTVTRPTDQKKHRALHGLSRALINNMVTGVTSGFEKTLEIVGVGYKATKNGKKLVLNMGYSHPVEIEEPEGIAFEVPNANTVVVKGIDKQFVGEIAAEIRDVRPPEPYKGKGIRYRNEIVRRKVGKTGM